MLKIDHVSKSYIQSTLTKKEQRCIVHDVAFSCPRGESVAIIGESGSGKSTLSRMILGIEKPDTGAVTLDGKPVHDLQTRKGHISAVFQDYTSSLHPFQTVFEILMEPLKAMGYEKSKCKSYMVELLDAVGLNASYLDRFPHMLSGGEAQRVAIARAISMKPDYILLDEAISSLDMSIQTQILELLIQLKNDMNMTYIFITHDIQAAMYLCENLIIFKDGQIQESMHISEMNKVSHPYTKDLIEKQLTI